MIEAPRFTAIYGCSWTWLENPKDPIFSYSNMTNYNCDYFASFIKVGKFVLVTP
jgi:hypothetical protein